MRGDELGDRLVVAQSAQERHRADVGNAVHVAQDGDQHFAVHEPAAVEQREDEIDLRLFEQHLVSVGELQVEPELFERRANFVMVDRVVAVLGVHAAAPQHVLGHEQHAHAVLGFLGNPQRFDRGGHRRAVLSSRRAINRALGTLPVLS